MASGARARGVEERAAVAAVTASRPAPLPDPLGDEATSPTIAVGTVGRLAVQKGLPYLVEAAEIVAQRLAEKRNPPERRRARGAEPGDRAAASRSRLGEVAFSAAGDGPIRDEIEAEISRRGLDGRFRLVGAVPDPWDYLATLDVFVLPSLWEGMPYALLEAMGAGLPVIATDVGGAGDLIPGVDPAAPGRYALCEHGIKVPPRDPAALARAILFLARRPRMRAVIGGAARARVLNEFSLEKMVEGCLGVYEEAVRR